MEGITENRGFDPKTHAGAVRIDDLMAGLNFVQTVSKVPAPCSSGGTKGQSMRAVTLGCENMAQVLVAAQGAGLNISDLLVMTVLMGSANDDAGESTVRISNPVVMKASGLSESAIKRAVAKLTKKGFLVRRQERKAQGCAATTLISEKAYGLMGKAGGASVCGMSTQTQGLLVAESNEVIGLVKKAWDEGTSLDDNIDVVWRGPARDLALLKSELLARADLAREALMTAAELVQKRQIEESDGIYTITASDGEVRVDRSVVLAVAEFSAADVKFGVETLNILAQHKPGMVTCERAPDLLAEVLYSRTFGFVVSRDYASAQSYLVNTMRKGWSRPKSIRDYWYKATSKACSRRLSTASSISVH